MLKPEIREALGTPDIKIAGLSIWVHGYQFPESRDKYDGNWLKVTVECQDQGAVVTVSGSILLKTEIASWRDSCKTLHQSLEGTAVLDGIEPNLFVEIRSLRRLGHVDMVVKITPDQKTQKHEFVFHIDQSYLPGLINQCDELMLRLRK